MKLFAQKRTDIQEGFMKYFKKMLGDRIYLSPRCASEEEIKIYKKLKDISKFEPRSNQA